MYLSAADQGCGARDDQPVLLLTRPGGDDQPVPAETMVG